MSRWSQIPIEFLTSEAHSVRERMGRETGREGDMKGGRETRREGGIGREIEREGEAREIYLTISSVRTGGRGDVTDT